MLFCSNALEIMEHVIAKYDRRDWTKLPPDYESDAVYRCFQEIRPFFSRRDIRQRIKASKARTFSDLHKSITG